MLRRLISSRKHVIVVDTKHELDWHDHFLVTESLDRAFSGERHVVYRPSTLEQIDYLFRRAYHERGRDIAVDELFAIGRGHVSSYPQSYIDCLVRGRSRGITMWSGTQRPKQFPRFTFTESKHLFLFELGAVDDLKYVADQAGCPQLVTGLQQYEFIYFRKGAPRTAPVRSRLPKHEIV